MGLQPGEVSFNALSHSCNLLKLELNSHWQRCLMESSKKSGETLDIDKMDIPENFSNEIIGKLDEFFMGLHDKIAIKNKIKVKSSNHSCSPPSLSTPSQTEVSISQMEPKKKKIKANKKIKLNFNDIIEEGCNMREDMTNIYLKSLELYNDIPGSFKKQKFKLPKKILKNYTLENSLNSNLPEILQNTDKDFINIDTLLRDKRLTSADKTKLKMIREDDRDNVLARRTFMEMQQAQTLNDLPISEMDFVSSKGNETEGEEYTADDCHVGIRNS